jgi:regulation of enolase protein 1 (concanavalin A-like superfamily)
MTKTWKLRAAGLAAVVLAVAAYADMPDPWKDKDIGDCGTKGSADCSKDMKITMKASGGDMWDTADAFNFAYQPLSGDGTIIAKVTSIDNTNEWSKGGVMIREKLEPGSKDAYCVVTPGNKSCLQWRTDDGGGADWTNNAVGDTAPYWVKLVRKGDVFTGSVSKDGTTWEDAGNQTISMAKDVFVGLCLTSHDNGQVCSAVFENVKISK